MIQGYNSPIFNEYKVSCLLCRQKGLKAAKHGVDNEMNVSPYNWNQTTASEIYNNQIPRVERIRATNFRTILDLEKEKANLKASERQAEHQANTQRANTMSTLIGPAYTLSITGIAGA